MTLERTWEEAWRVGRFRVEAVAAGLMMIAVAALFSLFLEYVEARPGVVLEDPLLALVGPRDVTWLTFSLIYACIIVALIVLVQRPDRFLVAIQGYTLLVLFRMGAMYLLALDPPPTMIPLKDPFVEAIVGDGEILTKDLFFSGHTSTMTLLTLTAVSLRFRLVFLAGTALVGFCVLVQHVHYSVDVLAAPFFAYGAVRAAGLIHERLRRWEDCNDR